MSSLKSPNLSPILNPVVLNELIDRWLAEDQPSFDLQTLACKGDVSTSIICKESCVLSGLVFLEVISSRPQIKVDFLNRDGDSIDVSDGRKVVANVIGNANQVLKFERLILNIISRCSGVATITRRIKSKLLEAGWDGYLAGTRKTTPGFRIPEKYSLLVGGGSTHRMDLSHMVMLKDNHVKSCGGISSAVQAVKSVGDFCSKIEVECSSLSDAIEAAQAGADIVMFDNMVPKDVQEASRTFKNNWPNVLIEVSGGINEDNIVSYAFPTVDIISTSCLVQGYPTIDFSMKVIDT